MLRPFASSAAHCSNDSHADPPPLTELTCDAITPGLVDAPCTAASMNSVAQSYACVANNPVAVGSF